MKSWVYKILNFVKITKTLHFMVIVYFCPIGTEIKLSSETLSNSNGTLVIVKMRLILSIVNINGIR